MNLSKYKKLNNIYSKFPIPKEICNTPEHEEYINAFHDDKKCQEWNLKSQIKKAGLNYKKYCCLEMAYYLIEDKEGKINYDSVITHRAKQKGFGIPIHDGGTSYIKINYCPWCSKKLK